MTAPDVTVVMLAYGDEPVLHAAVRSVLDSDGVDVTVVLVDNGCTSDAVRTLPPDPRLTVRTPAENLGFAGGVNHGAAGTTTTYLALVNSDAEVRPDALAALVRVAERPDVGIASGSIRLADRPDTMNSAGNPVHVVGLSWAGAYGEPATAHTTEQDIASASGAGLVLRRELWERLGGFEDTYFAYHEDVDLSWRTWQLGLRVVFVPDAVVLHHYEFSRNARKMFLLERNRASSCRRSTVAGSALPPPCPPGRSGSRWAWWPVRRDGGPSTARPAAGSATTGRGSRSDVPASRPLPSSTTAGWRACSPRRSTSRCSRSPRAPVSCRP